MHLYGKSFTPLTDQLALVEIFVAKMSIPVLAAARMPRCSLMLSPYDCMIEYLNMSSDQANANALSMQSGVLVTWK